MLESLILIWKYYLLVLTILILKYNSNQET